MNKQCVATDFDLDDKRERELLEIITELQRRYNISSADALRAVFLAGLLSVPTNNSSELEQKEIIKEAYDEIMMSSSQGDKEGYVYILKAKDENIFKVGITKGNPFHRIKTVQSGCPYELGVYAFMGCHDCRAKEAEFHSVLNRYCTHGEWFDVPSDIIDELIVQESVRIQLSDGKYNNPAWMSMNMDTSKKRDEAFDRLGISEYDALFDKLV